MQINLKYSIHAGNKYNTELLEKEEWGGGQFRIQGSIQDTEINLGCRDHRGFRDQFRKKSSLKDKEINLGYKDQPRIQRSIQDTEMNPEYRDQSRLLRSIQE